MRRVRRILPAEQKRAIKLAAMRDCGRRCVYCAAQLDYAGATLDHVYPLAKGGDQSGRRRSVHAADDRDDRDVLALLYSDLDGRLLFTRVNRFPPDGSRP